MKKNLEKMAFVGLSVLVLASCKKEETIQAPEPAESATSVNRTSEGGIIPLPKVYTLIKRGNDSLVYLNDGRLSKVQHSPTSFTQYTYGFNTITAKKYSGANPALDEETTYQIDVQKDRVFESNWTGYTYYVGGKVVVNKTYGYEYDAAGHLKSKYNKAQPNERWQFTWSAADKLCVIHRYDASNKVYHKAQFSNDFLSNKLGMLPVRSGLDVYLKIFGTAPKNLDEYELGNSGDGTPILYYDQVHYTFNNDGYPLKRTCHNVFSHQKTESTVFLYKITH